jgi:hypothetical protein
MRLGGTVAVSVFTRLALVCTSLACTPSDPGWAYGVPEGKRTYNEGLGYELDAQAGIRPTIHAIVFGGTLRIELSLRNESVTPATIRSATLAVADVTGRKLRPRATGSSIRCVDQLSLHDCELGRGQEFNVNEAFGIDPWTRGWLQSGPNPDLQEIAVTVNVSAVGKQDVVHIRLVRQDPR